MNKNEAAVRIVSMVCLTVGLVYTYKFLKDQM